ncbi:MAG: PQQ-binding-like beta-propeller repeat protein [Acidobacteriaceae bacterium]|nr:PQQ-binding-like beta-propeller repeat protein [Acidobacteriaceae bacterium]
MRTRLFLPVSFGLLLAVLAFKPSKKLPNRNGWPVYGGAPDNIHYSTLKQINRKNVKDLQVVWTFDTGDAFPGSEMECNPIIVNGILYATTPKLRVIALDAGTGKPKWSFDPNEGRRVSSKMRNRGVAYWEGSNSDKRIYLTIRQYLYALNAETGEPVTEFGDKGKIDLRCDLGRDPAQLFVSDTSPAIVYKDSLIVGSIVPETLPAAPGDIRAYDARTGKLRWSFHTIPHPGEYGYETWPKDAWQYIGGANNWCGMSLDAERGVVFVPTGSAAFDFYGANRLGDDLFANSLIALDANTGKRLWHFQTVRHDVWDRDLSSPPALVRVKHDGKWVDAAAQLTKSGWVYLFDRQTGQPLFPVEYRKYPKSEVDGEVTADTQPLPVKPAPFSRQIFTPDMVTDRTPEAHEAVLKQLQGSVSAGQFVPLNLKGTIVFPGLDGGGEWGGPAFDPETGILYVNSNEMAWNPHLIERGQSVAHSGKELYLNNCATCHRGDMKGSPPEFPSLVNIATKMDENEVMNMMEQGSGRMPSFLNLPSSDRHAIMRYVVYGEDIPVGAGPRKPSPIDLKYQFSGYDKFLDPQGYPAVKPPWGMLSAINLNTGEYVWKTRFGEYPELARQGVAYTGSENYGGGVVTAGGLFFIAATSYDKKMHAYDKATGELLWQTVLPGAGNATPAVYELNGKEYVVIACGGGKSKDPPGGSYVAFALPSKR